MDLKEQLKSLSAQDRKELLKQLQQEEKENKRNRRDAYEGLRAQFMLEVKNKLLPVVDDVKAFRDWVEKEAAAFRAVMREYGQLRKDEQASFTIVDGDMKLEVRSNKVKSFDERADLAAERLHLGDHRAGVAKAVEDQVGAGLGQAQCDAQADTTGRTGNQCSFALKAHDQFLNETRWVRE